ncbi:hypothetical protein HYW39_01390 [Candidatus Curtissbacteria bacterium]|nr:hypothetical protein [Candidatus Curtissbacteria bacterium]
MDFVKGLFGKKEQAPASPSEQTPQKIESRDGQFASPPNPLETQTTTDSSPSQSPPQDTPTS